MISQWLTWLNCFIAGIILILIVSAGVIWIQRPNEIACSELVSKQCKLPKNSFAQSKEAYQTIGEPLLALQNAVPTLQLPDLKQQLIYYGKNGRPDAQSAGMLLHFSFVGSKNIASIPPGEKLYLVYEKQTGPCRYTFSPQNAMTSLWLEASPVDNEAQVKLFMKNEKNEVIAEPESNAVFKLPEKEFIRYAGATWEIANQRVDGTLLARQRARWYGPDRFLERHGGKEYEHILGKQRIDFGENESLYSVFAGPGDCLVWDGRWKEAKPGEQSLKHPLLVVKKVDERLMTFELWDVEGKGKVILNLLKSTEPWLVQNAQVIQNMFKFVGARTKTQCVFEINKERMTICPSDWLLLTNKGWKKLSTEDEIKKFVERKTPGTLFVFKGLKRKDEKQMMLATLYNPCRSEFQEVEIPLQKKVTAAKPQAPQEPQNTHHKMLGEDEDDDDDDDEDLPAETGTIVKPLLDKLSSESAHSPEQVRRIESAKQMYDRYNQDREQAMQKLNQKRQNDNEK